MFSPEQVERINAALTQKFGFGGGGCRMCTSERLILLNRYVSVPMAPEPGKLYIGGASVLPAIALVCQHCGYVHFFSTIALGLSDLGPADAPDSDV